MIVQPGYDFSRQKLHSGKPKSICPEYLQNAELRLTISFAPWNIWKDSSTRVAQERYAKFEMDARRRLRGRDEDDWHILACALALGCDIWTEDADFFGTGVATWTTNRVEILLKKQTTPDEP